MSQLESPSEQITKTVISWPGVEAGPGRRGEHAFTLNGREIGHLHGDHAAHFFFPTDTATKLKTEGRVVDHPVFPGKVRPAAHRIEREHDVQDVIELLRLNYDRLADESGSEPPQRS
jgi:Luciferase